jgi:hypothetical protein
LGKNSDKLGLLATFGIDNKTALKFHEWFKLENQLRLNANKWKHQGLKEIPIPKKDGTTRMLKIPTTGDKSCLTTGCQAGLGDKSRGGLARFGRGDLTIPKSRFSGAVK